MRDTSTGTHTHTQDFQGEIIMKDMTATKDNPNDEEETHNVSTKVQRHLLWMNASSFKTR